MAKQSLIIKAKGSDLIDFDAQAFRDAIVDATLLITDILRHSYNSNGCDLDASEIANRMYVLQWLLTDAEIVDSIKAEVVL